MRLEPDERRLVGLPRLVERGDGVLGDVLIPVLGQERRYGLHDRGERIEPAWMVFESLDYNHPYGLSLEFSLTNGTALLDRRAWRTLLFASTLQTGPCRSRAPRRERRGSEADELLTVSSCRRVGRLVHRTNTSATALHQSSWQSLLCSEGCRSPRGR